MGRKIWTILLSVALIGCLFVPLGKEGDASAFDIFKNGMGGVWQNYVWLAIPLSAVLLLIGALNNGIYFLGRGIWTILPLLAILFIIGWPYLNGVKLDISALIKTFGIGMWGLLGVSVLLAFVHPPRK